MHKILSQIAANLKSNELTSLKKYSSLSRLPVLKLP